MGAMTWVFVAVSAISLALSVAAVVGAVRALVRRGARPPVLAGMGAGQYRRAGAVVIRGGPVQLAEVGALRAVAGEVAGQGHRVVLSAALAAVWVGLALSPVAIAWPWALARVLAAVVAVVMAGGAVWMARRVRGARRFLAVHPDARAVAR